MAIFQWGPPIMGALKAGEYEKIGSFWSVSHFISEMME